MNIPVIARALLPAAVRLVRLAGPPEGPCRCCGTVPPAEPARRARVLADTSELRANVATIAEFLLSLPPTYFEAATSEELRALAGCVAAEQAARASEWNRATDALASTDRAPAWVRGGAP